MSDNGFLKLDNAIIDYWMSRLSHSEFKTLLTIYRKTIGWNKQYDRISQNQIANLSGITTRSVRSAITSLEELGLIITTGKNKSAKVFTLDTNKLFNVCLKSDEVIEMESKLSGLEINSNNQCSEGNNDEINDPDDDDNCLHKRHSEYTNNIKVKEPSNADDINIPFDVFWDLYDYKKNKSLCITKWHSMTDEERTLTIESLDKYKQSTPDKTYRKYPLNYLENECWNDEHIVLADNQNIAHSNKYNSNNAINAHYANNNVFSASHKEFEPVITVQDNVIDTSSTIHTKDDLECNLEALGISSDTTTVVINSNESTVNTTVDIVALSSQVHWSELKARGMLKNPVNTNAVVANTDTDKKINDFLNRNSSKRFGGICKDIA